MLDVLILGAGISGLTAAHRLRRVGLRPVVLEASNRPGGTLSSRTVDGFRFETGPNTVIAGPELDSLCAAAGCAEDLQEATPAAKRRYLVHGGKLQALPSSPPALLASPLLSTTAKLRLLAEPMQRRGRQENESVRAFLARRFGPQAAKRFADVMVYGVYAGDPDELAIAEAFPKLVEAEQAAGSVLRGMAKAAKAGGKRRLVSFRGGFGRLAEALAADLEIRFGETASGVEATDEGFIVSTDGGERLTTRRLVTALPARATAAVLSGLGSEWKEPPHAPVAVVGLGFEAGQVGHALDGFGFLAPPVEKRTVLGCLFSSTLFADSAPSGATALTAMVGGRSRSELLDLDDATLIARVQADLQPLLDISGGPAVSVVRRWRPGIPQPTGVQSRLRQQAAQLEEAHPGLRVLGNWLHGVSVPDCLRAAATVDDLIEEGRR